MSLSIRKPADPMAAVAELGGATRNLVVGSARYIAYHLDLGERRHVVRRTTASAQAIASELECLTIHERMLGAKGLLEFIGSIPLREDDGF